MQVAILAVEVEVGCFSRLQSLGCSCLGLLQKHQLLLHLKLPLLLLLLVIMVTVVPTQSPYCVRGPLPLSREPAGFEPYLPCHRIPSSDPTLSQSLAVGGSMPTPIVTGRPQNS